MSRIIFPDMSVIFGSVLATVAVLFIVIGVVGSFVYRWVIYNSLLPAQIADYTCSRPKLQ